MEKSKKVVTCKKRSALSLQLSEESSNYLVNCCQNDSIMVKPLCSAKNQFQIKRELFRASKCDGAMPRKYSLVLDRLQREKEELIESIHILKESAICAIAEKEEHLQRLRDSNQSEKLQNKEVVTRLENKDLSIEKELELNNRQLVGQLNRERREMGVYLEQKQCKIEQQYILIEKLKDYIVYLQQSNRMAVGEIYELSQKIGYLTAQLQSTALSMAVEECKLDCDDKQMKIPTSVSSSPHYRSGGDLHNLNYLSQMNEEDARIQIERMYKERICEIQENYKREIVQLKEFYDNKIKNIRELYEGHLNEEQTSIVCSNHKEIAYHSHEPNPVTPIQKSINRAQSTKEYCRNYKKVVEFQCPEKISEPSVHNLKEQIGCTPEYLSYISIEEQGEFNKKYCENPFLFQKQKSSKSVNSCTEPQESQEVIKKQRQQVQQNIQSQKKQLNNQQSQLPKEPPMLFWEKAGLFATGLISGISLTSLVRFALKKKKYLRMG